MSNTIRSGPYSSQWPEPRSIASHIYRFPLEPTEGAAQRATAQSWGTWAWKGVKGWVAGPWNIGSWVGLAVLLGGLGFQIGFVSWFSNSRPRGPEDIHGVYSFWAWVVMSLLITAMALPYVLFLEPFLSRFLGGSSIVGFAGRKPLLIVLNVVATTVLLLNSVLPAVDGNYADHMPYMYIVAESAFLTGWLFGIVYSVVVAMANPGFPLAHIGLTPAVIAVMFLLTGMSGGGMIKDWQIRCNTGEEGGGPWDGCTATVASSGSSSGSSGTTTAPTDSCPCPNGAGTSCNCPFADDCSTHNACYSPSGGSIPSGCKHGCMPFG